MQVEQAVNELTRHLSERPFQPFRVVLDNGEQFEVTRQFQLGFGGSHFGEGEAKPGPAGVRRLAQISAVTALDVPARPRSDGT